MPRYTTDHIRAALALAQTQAPESEPAARRAQVNLLQYLAALKEEHASDADLARTLVECFDGSPRAYQWVREARQTLVFMLDVLALQVALEGKARTQRLAHPL